MTLACAALQVLLAEWLSPRMMVALQVEEFMKGLNVEQLPGVGPSLTDKLRHRGIHTVAELRLYSQVHAACT